MFLVSLPDSWHEREAETMHDRLLLLPMQVPTKLAISIKLVPTKLAVAVKKLSEGDENKELKVGDVFPKPDAPAADVAASDSAPADSPPAPEAA